MVSLSHLQELGRFSTSKGKIIDSDQTFEKVLDDIDVEYGNKDTELSNTFWKYESDRVQLDDELVDEDFTCCSLWWQVNK